MRPTIVRSLSAQRPDFFTFTTAGLTLPPALRARVLALPYTHDPAPLRAVAPEVPDELVDAVTLAGPPDEVARGVVGLGRERATGPVGGNGTATDRSRVLPAEALLEGCEPVAAG